MEDLAKEAENAVAKGEMSTVLKIKKQLVGKTSSQTGPLKDKDGNILTTEHEQAAGFSISKKSLKVWNQVTLQIHHEQYP